MNVIIAAESLNLPERYSRKLRGKKVELIENEDTIIIKPVKSTIDEAYGMFSSDGHMTDRFMEQKQIEKDIECSG